MVSGTGTDGTVSGLRAHIYMYIWIVHFTRPSLTSVKLDYSTWNIMYGFFFISPYFLTFMTASLGTQPWVDRYIRLKMRLNVPQLLPQKVIFSMPVYLAHTRVYSSRAHAAVCRSESLI